MSIRDNPVAAAGLGLVHGMVNAVKNYLGRIAFADLGEAYTAGNLDFFFKLGVFNFLTQSFCKYAETALGGVEKVYVGSKVEVC